MNEFELIQHYFARATLAADVKVGIGDDCAVLHVPAGKDLLLSVDTLVEGVHFVRAEKAELIAERALRTALSDLAAMGAEARWFTLALSLPEANSAWLQSFAAGLFAAARACGELVLVGGDTTRGPLCISVQVQGVAPSGTALLRSGAQLGDLIYVSGTLGDAAAALPWVLGEKAVEARAASESRDYLLERYYRPTPRLVLGEALRGKASAAIDISDGLVADLGHLCRASGVGAELQLHALPFSAALLAAGDISHARRCALYGGDDYELCYTLPLALAAEIEALSVQLGLALTCIGRVVEVQGVFSTEGQQLDATQSGYRHF